MRYLGRRDIRMWSRLVTVATVAVCGLAADALVVAQTGGDRHWVGTWATATVARDPQPESDGFGGRPTAPPLNFNTRRCARLFAPPRVALGCEWR